MTDKTKIYRARNELKGMRESQEERKETCCANLRLKINIQRNKRERERESEIRRAADKTHARDESTEARFPRAVAAAAGCK